MRRRRFAALIASTPRVRIGARKSARVVQYEPILVVRDQDRYARLEGGGDELVRRLQDLIGLEQTRHVPRELVERAGALLSGRGDTCLVTQSRGHLPGNER